MGNGAFSSYKIDDRSFVSFIKREIHNLAGQAGFSDGKLGEIDIIVSELTSNLIKFAGSGELLYKVREEKDNASFEIYCLDGGPGIEDISKVLKDGISTSNTLGQGLGAISRLSNEFHIHSVPGKGTIIYSKTLLHPIGEKIAPKGEFDYRALQVCYPGEKVSGDAYFVRSVHNGVQVFMGDGLGHGEKAHEAVQCAVEAFRGLGPQVGPEEALRFIHQKVKKTRGLVGTIVQYDKANTLWRICGVGNITTRLGHGLVSKGYASNNGILGLSLPGTMHQYEVPVDPNQLLVMHSDGIAGRWEMSDYQTSMKNDLDLIVPAIFKENARRNDDMTVLAGKINV